MWDAHVDDDQPWGILMIDTRNASNEWNRKMMVWVARYLWPSGVRFLLNMYRHHAVLILRGTNKNESVFIFSREGIVQGYPLSTTGYGLLILPLIRKLKVEFNSVEPRLYTDDGTAAGSLESISSFFKRLEDIGPAYGYFPEESKSILVVRGRDTEKANIFKEKYNCNFEIKNGYRCLGGHIGDLEEKTIWVETKLTSG